ncbi:MAG: 50S ribosomal protein L21 [Candidatus Andersenbacteria bacterium]
MERFAIVQINGKQYLAHKGARLLVDRMNHKESTTLTLKDVLLVHEGAKTTVGTPHVAGVTVKATVVSHPRGPKGQAFRYARKKRVRRLKGFRAAQTELEITAL